MTKIQRKSTLYFLVLSPQKMKTLLFSAIQNKSIKDLARRRLEEEKVTTDEIKIIPKKKKN